MLRMWPSVTAMMAVAGWVCAWSAAENVHNVYKKVGDEVVLQPGSAFVSGSITWKHGPHIAIEWDGTTTEPYRQFRGRSRLNISTGEMTITGLTRDCGGVYTPEFTNGRGTSTFLIIISPVPTPTVLKSCDDQETSCVLTCDGNTTDAEPVTYKWRSDNTVSTDSTKEHLITKEDSSSINEFSCELKNPVSQERSQPIPNPFTKTPLSPDSPEGGTLKISTGVTVFISLLAAVLLLALFHRWKAGMWFYQKESMPWEAGFWKKDERTPTAAADSNGASAQPLQKEPPEEETGMP